MKIQAYLEITLYISKENRAAAAGIFTKYREPFLKNINGALTKELLLRDEDVQVLHGFNNLNSANEYLKSELFIKDVATELQPLWSKDPDIRVYSIV